MSSSARPTDTLRLRSRLVAKPHRLQPVLEPVGPAGPWPRLRPAAANTLADRDRWSLLSVRAFDVVVSLVGLVVLFPMMLAVAIAIKLDSPGPVLYGSPRIGQRRTMFRAWKFRSMWTGADAELPALLARDPAARREFETFHKLRRDPRLTPVGAVIRRTSLDELPQLFNVLIGEMSIVGPRPKLLRDAEVFGPALVDVLRVKPGLTGLWQVSGRNRLPIRDQIALDLQYARTRSLAGDLRICAKTLVQIWNPGKHGAY